MKIKKQFILVAIIGLTVGLGAGFYMSEIRNSEIRTQVLASRQARNSQQLQAARAALSDLRANGFSDSTDVVIRQKQRIAALEKTQQSFYMSEIRNSEIRTQVLASQQARNSQQLQAARAALSDLRANGFSDSTDVVIRQKQRIAALEKTQQAQ